MVRGREWTGFEAAALQEAMRKSIRDYAALLGVETTTINNWRSGLGSVRPRSLTQGILDTTLERRTTSEDRARFEQIVAEGEATWRARHRTMPTDETTVSLETVAKAPISDERADHSGLEGAAHASLAFAQWATDTVVDELSIESLYLELARIAATYVHQPLRPLLLDLVAQRDRAWQLLKLNPHPQQMRELLYLGSVAAVMLAEATGDLGHPIAAMKHAIAADRLARQAGHSALRAWIAGTQALITEWSGSPNKALNYVRRASEHAPPGHQRVRLAALEARAAARVGRKEDVRDALRRTRATIEEPADGDNLREIGGILGFSVPKALYYSGSALSLIGEHAKAEHSSLEAIASYEAGPPEARSYGDEALARANVAVARIVRHDLEGAGDALAPVLALPQGQRIQSIRDGLGRVDQHLTAGRHANAPTAHSLHEAIAAFTPSRIQALP